MTNPDPPMVAHVRLDAGAVNWVNGEPRLAAGGRLGEGAGDVWVVFATEHDHSGEPEFLAAYDGEDGAQAAAALVSSIKKAGCSRNVIQAKVPLWPMLNVPT